MTTVWRAIGRTAQILFRVTTGLFMAAVLVAVAYWAWGMLRDFRLEQVVSQTRDWEKKELLLSIPFTATLKTRCSESRLYYVLRVAPKEQKNESGKRASQNTDWVALIVREVEEFRIILRDSDHFHRILVKVNWEHLWPVRGDGGREEELEANASTSCPREDYAKVTSWTMAWIQPKR